MLDRPGTGHVILVAALPAALALLLTIFWVSSDRLRPGGDEPHYLIMALSLLEDHDLRLKNNYEIDCVTGEIYGCVEPHAFRFEHAWVPYHQPGLSAIVALPYAVAHVGGARIAMVAIASILPVLLLAWLAPRIGASTATWLTLAACLSPPIVFGGSMLYPDLPAGVVLTGLTLWLLQRGDVPDSPLAWAAFWALNGLLCWLNLKFALATVILGLWAVARVGRRRVLTPSFVIPMLLAVIGPIGLAVLHQWGFGSIFGGRGGNELAKDPLRVLLFFLGYHLDQGHGLFLQNPMLLAGVPALVVWARRDPKNALWWLLLYASIMLPNSMQMGRYGGNSPAGRYAWSVEWLWLIPVGMMGATYAARLLPFAIAVFVYQFALAVRWMPDPTLLMPIYDAPGWERNSLYPMAVRPFAPSFYDWTYSEYLTRYPANMIAVMLLIGLVAAGWFLARRDAGVVDDLPVPEGSN